MAANENVKRDQTNVVAFAPRSMTPGALDAEAARRVARLGYERWLVRERATGMAVPPAIRHLKLQIEFAAEAMKALDRPPENFRADCFWPA